jgi:hypothetical protein
LTAARAVVADVAGSGQGVPNDESVRRRAQEIYERRMREGLPGDAESDWLQAEAELAAQVGRTR